MRRILFAVLVLVFAFQAPAFAASQKIAIASMAKLIKESEAGQDAQKKMEKKFETAKKQLEGKQKELEKLKQSLQKQSLVLSLEAKQDKEIEFKRKVRDYQDLAQATQRKMQLEEKKAGTPVLQLIQKVVNEYGKKNGYTAIYDKKTSGLLYVDETVDITNQLLLEMNRAFRAGKK
ncbi:OmpH family outer membrane protein [Desulfovibrio sp. JC010]|uniref:OmpH family outer membrane protein n=1 Tax=Desulfovibrio sp. JC010 TaxID=2593641 RepID=UPI0013D1097B|nr:OmpH family outer membrane protein [Desulfovibrio sp. JC010]NDV28500.1 OmpH family outer membrane protein [Desulfovibrio sp. JC010]